MCHDSLLSGRGRSVRAKISGEGVVRGEYFLVSTKLGPFLLSDSANCTMLRAVVLTQYRRVTDRRTDRQTDGIAVASTALAMRALQRAVKTATLTGNEIQIVRVNRLFRLPFCYLVGDFSEIRLTYSIRLKTKYARQSKLDPT